MEKIIQQETAFVKGTASFFFFAKYVFLLDIRQNLV